MRVLFLATGVFDKGGISRYGRYQVRALREGLGEGVRCFSLLGPSGNDFEEPFPVEYHGKKGQVLNKAKFAWKAFQMCLSWKPDIVWCNHLHILPLGLILRAFLSKARLLVNVYGLELWTDRQWLHQRTLPRSSLVVADCHFSTRFVTKRYSVPENRVRVVWDCVDTKRFQPACRRDDLLSFYGVPTGGERRYILSLGRIVRGAEHKGYDRLIDCMGRLRQHRNFILLFAGDGNDRPRLEKRVREEDLTDRIFFLGSVPEDQLVDVYNLCDLFVHVSDRGHGRGEGLPLTPLEAAACGKPIVVGNEDGSQEAVTEGVNGRIVSPRSLDAIMQAIREILLNDELQARMGAAARLRAEQEFGYERFRAQIAQILQELGHVPEDSSL